MKKYILIFTVFISFLATSQTVKQIINKNIELTGGITNWKLLNSIVLQGKVILGVNDEFSMKIYQQRPNLTKTVITIANKENVIEGFDGKYGYSMNYATNKLQVQKDYIAESFDTDYIDYEMKGFTASLLGREKVGDRDCYKIELTKNVNKTIYFFDVQNYLLLKEVKKDETLVYDDYKRVNNFLMPFRIESSSPKKDGDFTMVLTKIEINKAFPANTFKF